MVVSKRLIDRLCGLGLFSTLFEKKTPFSVEGLNEGLLSLLTFAHLKEKSVSVLYVSDDLDVLTGFYSFLEDLLPGRVYIAREDLADSGGLFASENRKNFDVFYSSLQTKSAGVFLSDQSLLNKIVCSEKIKNGALSLRLGLKIRPERILESLDAWGYDLADLAAAPKTVSRRGGILDIFPMYASHPVRVEFFGDLIETMRLFNPVSQLSFENIESFKLSPPSGYKKEGGVLLDEMLRTSVSRRFLINKNDRGLKVSNNTKCAESLLVAPSVPNLFSIKLSDQDVFVFGKKTKSLEKLGFLSSTSEYMDAPLHSGFYLNDEKLLVLGYNNVGQLKPTAIRSKQSRNPVVDSRFNIQNIELGDLVVHENYGVGVFDGLSTIRSAGNFLDCVLIKYADGVVRVFPEHFRKLHLYVSTGSKKSSVSFLSKKGWNKQLLRTKKAVDEIIHDLVLVYSERKNKRGFNYTNDNELLEVLADSFPFEETTDQFNAIKETLGDMDKDVPMDRVVLGDVGFGKTEVAVRAAMKAVASGKQVFVIAPTTILVDQHYITFNNRLSGLGVRTSMLSRFLSKKESEKILDKVSSHKTDIVVGTHKLLSEKVDTDGLGLLIVDEEHRFGVKHKEYIRRIKMNVDVLTLTATPIPRTLQQSLVGLRDISRIETPPKERLPIKTNVIVYSLGRIKQAVQRELSRNGQVYYLHNDIQSIPFVVEKLRSLFPGQRVEAAHGSMSSRGLEKTVLDFFSGDIDILICTTIIESGLDVTNANTIIINNAHRLGLSQLYQIRGRVGRGNVQAYCWLQIPNKNLNKDAYSRLKAVEHYSALGSGYEIAMKDLEIRGSGNLFGLEQSGHINNVGYSLYCKILKDRIDREVGKNSSSEKESFPSVRFSGDAFFPDSFLPLAQDRLYYYQRLATSKVQNDIDRVSDEMRDRFGPLPVEVKNVIAVSSVRAVFANSPVESVSLKKSMLGLVFKKPSSGAIDIQRVFSAADLTGSSYSFNKDGGLSLSIDSSSMDETIKNALSIGKLLGFK